MRVLLFGATGMVGQAVLRECLLHADVESVLSIGRTVTGTQHPKLREIARNDLFNYSDIETELSPLDACFFTLGVTSAGMNEEDYTRITYQLTLAAANVLVRLNPHMTFVYVSGAGTDSSEKGSTMWARVKGRTENALLRLPFTAYMFRPGVIQPLHGITSKTKSYRILYSLTKPILPLLRILLPNYILTTEEIAQAMLEIVKHGYTKRVLETSDMRALLHSKPHPA